MKLGGWAIRSDGAGWKRREESMALNAIETGWKGERGDENPWRSKKERSCAETASEDLNHWLISSQQHGSFNFIVDETRMTVCTKNLDAEEEIIQLVLFLWHVLFATFWHLTLCVKGAVRFIQLIHSVGDTVHKRRPILRPKVKNSSALEA